MHGTPAQAGDAPPLFAQHTTDILRGLGLNEQEIEALVSTGAAPSQR
jgi:crotonobetainyl-CoA:carnitine CoA-transferase CaiB-like acyl-CoA transferase